jgi:hypothetical protein
MNTQNNTAPFLLQRKSPFHSQRTNNWARGMASGCHKPLDHATVLPVFHVEIAVSQGNVHKRLFKKHLLWKVFTLNYLLNTIKKKKKLGVGARTSSPSTQEAETRRS